MRLRNTRPAAGLPRRTPLAMAAGLLVLASLTGAAAAQGRQQAVVSDSQAVPGLGGATFDDISRDIAFNDAGQVAFLGRVGATLFNAPNTIFVGQGNTLTPIAISGQPAPGSGGGVVESFGSLGVRMNASGMVTFKAFLSNGNATEGVFSSNGSGTLTTLALAGQSAPGGAGATFTSFFNRGLNDAGQALFMATIDNGSFLPVPGLYLTNANGGAMRPVAVFGQAAPGLPGGTFTGVSTVPALNNSGQVLANTLATTGLVPTEGLYLGDGTQLDPIALEGQQAPGTGGKTFLRFTSTALNDSGSALFHAELSGSGEGLFISQGNTITALAVTGQVAAGTGGGTFQEFSEAARNQAGQVVFAADVGNSSTALYRSNANGTELMPLALSGQTIAPGTGGGVFDGTFLSPAINESGVVLFGARYTTGIGSDYGLFLADHREIIAAQTERGQVDGKPIDFLDFLGAKLNSHGQVAYWALFDDGTHGINVFTPTLRWRESFSASWSTAEHWTLGITPAAVHDVRIDPDTPLTVTGPAQTFSVRSLTVGGGGAQATFRMAGGTLDAETSLQVASNGLLIGQGSVKAEVVNDGRVRTETGQGLELIGTGHVNRGRVEVQGTLLVTGRVDNEAGGTIGLDGGHISFADGLANRGLLQVDAGGGQVFGHIDNLSGSRIAVVGGEAVFHGTLQVRSGAELRVAPGASVEFKGAVEQATGAVFGGGGNKLYNGGFGVGSSPGFGLDAGNVRFGAGNVYLAEIGGTRACTLACDGNPALADEAYDRYVVEGTLFLGGTLRLVSWNQMVAQEGQVFDLFDWGMLQGRFDSIDASGLRLAEGTVLDFSRLYSTGQVGVTAVPEPGTWGLMAAGLLGLGLRLRRRPAR